MFGTEKNANQTSGIIKNKMNIPRRLGDTEADRVLEIARDIFMGDKPVLTSNPRMNEAAADIANYLKSPSTMEIEGHNLSYLFALFALAADSERLTPKSKITSPFLATSVLIYHRGSLPNYQFAILQFTINI